MNDKETHIIQTLTTILESNIKLLKIYDQINKKLEYIENKLEHNINVQRVHSQLIFRMSSESSESFDTIVKNCV